MADYRALMAVGEAVVNLLRSSSRSEDFNAELEFRTFTARDFAANAIANGVSLFLYRIFPFGTHRTPPGRLDAEGRRLQGPLPLELHFLLTVWAREASLQHAIAGWMMRTLEDTPLLTAGTLNAAAEGAFRPDEIVDVSLAELSNEDLLRIWEVLGLNVYQLSVPYLARTVRIESLLPRLEPGGGPVQERIQDAGVLRAPAALTA
jgi:hypothetical protein